MTKEETRFQLLSLAASVVARGPSTGTGSGDIVEMAATFEAYVNNGTRHDPHDREVPKQHAPANAPIRTTDPAPQPAAPQSAPTPQPGAATATVAQCAEAFQRHVKKGGGRSAITARKAVIDALPHFQSFNALTPEECATAVAAMDRATDAA